MKDITRRSFVTAASSFCAAAAISRPVLAFQGGAAGPSLEPMAEVAPELRPVLLKFRSVLERMAAKPADATKIWASYALKPMRHVPSYTLTVPGRRGDPDVGLMVVNARSGSRRPAILHTHGGGYTAGSVKDTLPVLQRIASSLDCLIVSVDYRLAPATTFIGSIEDNYIGLKWLYDNAGRIGADPARIAVMGESAGGGHAALLAGVARDRGEVPLIFQCLVYPMLDDRTGTTRTVPSHIGRQTWTSAQNHIGWKAFLGVEPGGADVPTGAVPARAETLAGLPPAWIGVGGIDLFVEEDIDYAKRLIDAGVPTTLNVVPGAFHGFDNLPEMLGMHTAISDKFNAAKIDALRRAFELGK